MLGPRAGMIDCFRIETGKTISTTRNALTPNGKRYELREVGAPEHPETLTTMEDYENAPEGTIAVISDGLGYPIVKHFGKWWRNGIAFSSDDISEDTREVLREGWDV